MSLTAEAEIPIRFSEADMLGIVWHGHYVQYLEEGRLAFGARYGLGYLYLYENGYSAPIVKLNLDYKFPLRFGEQAVVETRFVPTDAAKIIFHYTIREKTSRKIVATAETVQVFLRDNKELSLVLPEFYATWRKKWGLSD